MGITLVILLVLILLAKVVSMKQTKNSTNLLKEGLAMRVMIWCSKNGVRLALLINFAEFVKKLSTEVICSMDAKITTYAKMRYYQKIMVGAFMAAV